MYPRPQASSGWIQMAIHSSRQSPRVPSTFVRIQFGAEARGMLVIRAGRRQEVDGSLGRVEEA